LVWCDLQRR